MSDWLRVFVDNIGKRIETLPDFEGDPDNDVLLQRVLIAHRQRHHLTEVTIGGSHPDISLVRVQKKHWADDQIRNKIIEEIRKKNNHEGIGDDFYTSFDFYKEEAVKCYRNHGSPTNPGCIDYKTKAKELGNPLFDDEDRAALEPSERKSLFAASNKIYLCDFCPYESYLMQHIRGDI